jgi:hypothetical protein
MAPLPIPAATFRFARANSGITTTEAAAMDHSSQAPFRRFVADQRGAGFVENVQRQGNEAPADDSQGGPLDLLTKKPSPEFLYRVAE